MRSVCNNTPRVCVCVCDSGRVWSNQFLYCVHRYRTHLTYTEHREPFGGCDDVTKPPYIFKPMPIRPIFSPDFFNRIMYFGADFSLQCDLFCIVLMAVDVNIFIVFHHVQLNQILIWVLFPLSKLCHEVIGYCPNSVFIHFLLLWIKFTFCSSRRIEKGETYGRRGFQQSKKTQKGNRKKNWN